MSTQPSHYADLASGPPVEASDVTPSDSADLSVFPRGLWVGVSGNVRVGFLRGSAVTLVGVQGLIPGVIKRVYATGTTATNIVALY